MSFIFLCLTKIDKSRFVDSSSVNDFGDYNIFYFVVYLLL